MSKLILSLLAAAVLLAGSTPASATTGGTYHPALEAAIQPYAPRVTQVQCLDGMGRGYGYTYPEMGIIVLNSYFCNPLEQLVWGVRGPIGRQGAGLSTLVHEAIHNKYWLSEARTECLAFQEVDDVAAMWNIPLWFRGEVIQAAYRDHIRFVAHAPRYRNVKKCRENGAWDTTPGDGRWP